MLNKKPFDFDVFKNAANSGGSGIMSPLHRWMIDNYKEFAKAIYGIKQPNWNKISIELNKMGLTDANGNNISAKIARQTWWKTKKTKQRIQKMPLPAPTYVPEPRPAPAPIPAPQPAPTPASVDDRLARLAERTSRRSQR